MDVGLWGGGWTLEKEVGYRGVVLRIGCVGLDAWGGRWAAGSE